MENIGRRQHRNKFPRSNYYSFTFECGLLLGIICAMCGGIILILNIIYLGDESKALQSYSSYHGYRTFLNIVCILACVFAFIGIYRNRWQYNIAGVQLTPLIRFCYFFVYPDLSFKGFIPWLPLPKAHRSKSMQA